MPRKIKSQPIYQDFNGIKQRVLTDIDRNVMKGLHPIGEHIDEEDYRCLIDDTFEIIVKQNTNSSLSEGQIDVIKHEYLNDIFMYLDQKIEDYERIRDSKTDYSISKGQEIFCN